MICFNSNINFWNFNSSNNCIKGKKILQMFLLENQKIRNIFVHSTVTFSIKSTKTPTQTLRNFHCTLINNIRTKNLCVWCGFDVTFFPTMKQWRGHVLGRKISNHWRLESREKILPRIGERLCMISIILFIIKHFCRVNMLFYLNTKVFFCDFAVAYTT